MKPIEVRNRQGSVVARLCFTDRSGGYSEGGYDSLNLATHVGDAPIAVAANRAAAAALIGLAAGDVTWPGLTHSTDVGVVAARQTLFPDVDILVTRRRGQGLATMAADCVPLLAVEPEAGVALSAHIGWQGAAAGIDRAIAGALTAAGAKTECTQAFLGPAICGECYRVPPERQAAVAGALPASATSAGVDLRAGLAAALTSMGMRVEVVGGCTFEQASLFSHRRDGVTGRQGGLVVLS